MQSLLSKPTVAAASSSLIPSLLVLLRGPTTRYTLLPLRRHASSKSKTSDPLRILFCGSEDFSIASLRALRQEQRRDPGGLIASIDVVCRPPKRVGRSLKAVREVPLAQVARELSLPLHEIDTFTEWDPPMPQGEKINMVIAVSFGLFVPPRILSGAKYGGLNVHPSMLPDFQGAAPLHHTLLSNEENIGLTLQTLDPDKFDHGQILAQSEYPGFKHSCGNVPELMNVVAPKGAEMLVNGLRDLVYVPPRQDVGWHSTKGGIRPIRRAPKITPEDRHIDWDTWTAERILRTHHVIGPLWNNIGVLEQGKPLRKRIIWSSGFARFTGSMDIPTKPGRPIVDGIQSNAKSVLIKTCDGHALQVFKVKIGGGSSVPAFQEIKRLGTVDYFT